MSETTASAATLPQVGDIAPDFTLPREDGSLLRLSDLRPQQVVLYFYPKDNTPGCTLEALDFTRLVQDFAAANTRVIGISKDSVAAHGKFCAKQGLAIALVSDAESSTCEAYGTWGEKSLYGRKFMGISRTTLLIGGDGAVLQVWPKVKVKGHAEAVLLAAQAANAAAGKGL